MTFDPASVDEPHVITYQPRGKFESYLGTVKPSCTCGWTGTWRNRRFAELDAQAHLDGAVCPNVDDPVLCKIHGGVFIPECGCPVHDREEVERP